MVEAPGVRTTVDCDIETSDSSGHSRRLKVLCEQLVRENRRAAGPFSHPLAAQGPLWRLREQIRDVSRIADAVVASAELASDSRMKELCSDLRRLLQTQQAWTERLENQIWRLESQAVLMKRLQQVLLHGSPGTDQIWQLCELIARETQAIPDGLLLLPEPGQRIALPTDGVPSFAAISIEQARLSVFAGMSQLPDIRGAELVAGTLLASAIRVFEVLSNEDRDAANPEVLAFAQKIQMQTSRYVLSHQSTQLIQIATNFTLHLEQASLTAAESIVPPGIREFYRVVCSQWPSGLGQEEQQLATSFCGALGISAGSPNSDSDTTKDGDDRLVLAHQLRWHDGDSTRSVVPSEHKTKSRVRRPNFLGASAERPRFSVFAE